MEMVDMKRQPPAKDGGNVMAMDDAYYPLSLYLNKEELAKLGLSGCKIGEEKLLHAQVRVTSISAGEYEGGESYESVTLTVIKAAVDQGKKAAESVMYGAD